MHRYCQARSFTLLKGPLIILVITTQSVPLLLLMSEYQCIVFVTTATVVFWSKYLEVLNLWSLARNTGSSARPSGSASASCSPSAPQRRVRACWSWWFGWKQGGRPCPESGQGGVLPGPLQGLVIIKSVGPFQESG